MLQIDDQEGKEHLHRHGEQAEGRKGEIELGIGPGYRGGQAVEQVFDAAALAAPDGLVPDEEEGDDAHGADGQAKDAEELLPSPLPGQAVKSPEDHQHGNQRQDGQHALRPAPVGGIGDVRDVGVEGGVVGGGAEEGHDAVHDHH